MIKDSGLRVLSEELGFYTERGGPMDFATWTARRRTPADKVARLREIFCSASPQLREALRIEIAGE